MKHSPQDWVDEAISRWQEDGLTLDEDGAATAAIFTRMALVSRAVSEHKARAVAGLGVAGWVVETVYALRRRGRPYRAGPSELAAELGITQAAMTARARGLVAQGLVVRHTDPDDGRRVVLALTAKGHRLTERIFRAQQGLGEDWLAALSPRDRAGLDRMLRVLLATVPGGTDIAAGADVSRA